VGRTDCTVEEYLLTRLKQIGVDHLSGVPGDFVLAFFNQVMKSDVQYTHLANQPVVSAAEPMPAPRSDPNSLAAAADAVVAAIAEAWTVCILPGILVARAGLQAVLQAVVDASGLSFATMFMDKAVLDERQPGEERGPGLELALLLQGKILARTQRDETHGWWSQRWEVFRWFSRIRATG
jgi:TPP-dependent 2-oxoacid decarboxylase